MKKIAILLFNLPIDGALAEKQAPTVYFAVFDMIFLGVNGTIRQKKTRKPVFYQRMTLQTGVIQLWASRFTDFFCWIL